MNNASEHTAHTQLKQDVSNEEESLMSNRGLGGGKERGTRSEYAGDDGCDAGEANERRVRHGSVARLPPGPHTGDIQAHAIKPGLGS